MAKATGPQITPDAVDEMDLEELLRIQRFAPVSSIEPPILARMMRRTSALRLEDPAGYVATSKRVGWKS